MICSWIRAQAKLVGSPVTTGVLQRSHYSLVQAAAKVSASTTALSHVAISLIMACTYRWWATTSKRSLPKLSLKALRAIPLLSRLHQVSTALSKIA